MRLTLRQLQIFLAVSDHGSTMAAADAVALSQSAASAALNELEGVLGVQLFDRVGRRLVLNDNGRLLLPQARQMLDWAQSIEQQFSVADGNATGLQIGASMTVGTYFLPRIVAACATEQGLNNPRVMIANTADIVAAVAGFTVDVGLIEGPCHDPELQVEPWISDEMVIVCAPTHPLAQKNRHRKVTLRMLREAHWLLREPGSGTREVVENALLPHLHQLRSAGEFGNSEAIKHAAAAGLGVSCMSRLVVSDLLESGRLVELATTLPAFSRSFYLVYRKNKLLSARLRSFIDFCRAWPMR
ncbi:MAG TPA: LysR family transcriptional regulator [Oxalicibacterium sp.]|nr:LysR family transcriptional regulator [Oxalicibacterium sp.]